MTAHENVIMQDHHTSALQSKVMDSVARKYAALSMHEKQVTHT